MAIKTHMTQDASLCKLITNFAKLVAEDMDASEVLEWVNEEFDPEDVFDADKLATWAENNGYVKDE